MMVADCPFADYPVVLSFCEQYEICNDCPVFLAVPVLED